MALSSALFSVFIAVVLVHETSATGSHGYMLLHPGQKCHPNSATSKCQEGLVCVGEVCRIPDRGVCTDYPTFCQAGLSCVGRADLKKCKVLRKVDERCGQDLFWVCEDGLVCEETCKIPKGGACANSMESCAKDLECLGSDSKKVCGMRVPVGSDCEMDSFDFCDAGLVCEDKECKVPEGGSCESVPADSCVSGTVCRDNKKCESPPPKPVTVGGECNKTGKDMCGDGLVCESNICKIKQFGVCNEIPAQCAMGFSCVGTGETKKCNKLKGVGQKCHIDPFWVCKDGLTCEDNKCKIKQFGVCTDNPTQCAMGFSCVGTGQTKKCNKLKRVGQRCHIDPFWVCEENLQCEDNTCKVPSGGTCTNDEDDCVTGTECIGTKSNKKCKVLRKVDETCGQDPFWVCEGGLICDGKCKIPKDGVCTMNKESCAKGLECLGSGAEKRCEMRVPVGSVCETDPFELCENGLVCEEKECKIAMGGPCGDAPSGSCVSSTICGDNEICVKPPPKPVGVGEVCNKTGMDKCESNLVCEKNMCKIKRGGVCTKYPNACSMNLSCVGTGSTKRCNKLMGPGERCEVDPFWVCQDGLVCQNKRCRIAAGDVCTRSRRACVSGTWCVGTRTVKRCKAPKGLGEQCGKDPFWVCHRGLTCDRRDYRCKLRRGRHCNSKTGKYCVSGSKCVGYRYKKCW